MWGHVTFSPNTSGFGLCISAVSPSSKVRGPCGAVFEVTSSGNLRQLERWALKGKQGLHLEIQEVIKYMLGN